MDVTLCEQLKGVLDQYFGQYPNVSINGLATKSGVGATTIRRILTSSIKGDPAPHTVLNLVSAIFKEHKLKKLLGLVEGPIGELLRRCFGHFADTENETQYDSDLNEILSDKINYIIYKLAANKVGVTRTKIVEFYGRLGVEKLDDLLEQGIVKEDDGIIHANVKDFCLDINLAKKHTPELVSFYKPDCIDQGQNLFYTLSESVNEDGIKKIKEIQKEAVKQISVIMRSPYYEGSIPYFSLQICDTLEMSSQPRVMQ